MNVAYHEPMLELAERLVPVMPKGLASFVFATSYVSISHMYHITV